MLIERYEIKTHEQYNDGFVVRPIETAYNKKQLYEKVYNIARDCKKAEASGHKIYSMDITYYGKIALFGIIPIKEVQEKVFHWDCYKKYF